MNSSSLYSTLLDFDDPMSTLGWTSVNDVVMGGSSCSQFNFNPNGYAEFSGEVSLKNNGGFASIRSAPSNYSIVNIKNLCLCILGDGHRYKLNLRMDNFPDGINYQALFTPPRKWSEIKFSYDNFKPCFHGNPVSAPPLDFSRINQIGLMIGDRQEGSFTLLVRWLRAEVYP
ncbi:CIA30 family protein [Nitrosomonadaceae bacterium]|nr:CIA30 family protein [Nitrosomonadaceae bacterium]